jgi:hypothetical protein
MALQPLMVGLVLVSNDWNVGTDCEERQKDVPSPVSLYYASGAGTGIRHSDIS